MNEFKWNNIEMNDEWPTGKMGTELVYYNGNIYLYGGKIDRYKYSSELWKYNIELNKWNQIYIKSYSPKCYGHRMVLYKDYLIIFGGYGKRNKQWICCNDVYIYGINNNRWKRIKCKNKPFGRFWHAMCIVNNNLIIHGGKDIYLNSSNDMHKININDIINNKSPKWIEIDNSIPSLSGHLILVNDGKLYCFGGETKIKLDRVRNSNLLIYNDNDFNTKIVHEIAEIYPRSTHNGCIIYLNDCEYIFVFGGWGNAHFDETFLISTQENNINVVNLMELNEDTKTEMNDDDQTNNDLITNETNNNGDDNKIKALLKQINELQNEIIQLKVSNNHLKKMNGYVKNENENKVQSLSNQVNNDEQKMDNELTKKEELFKDYFFKTFDNMKSNKIYYNNLIENDVNDFNIFIIIENMDDINEYIKPKNKLHANLILKKIKQIKNDRNNFESKLKMINMFDYLDNFDSNGIYTLKEYNNKITNINDLKSIIKNNKACNIIFNSINNDINIEGQQGTSYF